MFFDDPFKPISLNFVERRDNNLDVLRMMAEKYGMSINAMVNHTITATPKIDLEITMDAERLEQLREDLRRAVFTPMPWAQGLPYVTTTTTCIPPSVTITPVSDGRPCMICTKEQKEKFISMVERYCDTCFLDGTCEEQDDYDCRKCLERRMRWELTD